MLLQLREDDFEPLLLRLQGQVLLMLVLQRLELTRMDGVRGAPRVRLAEHGRAHPGAENEQRVRKMGSLVAPVPAVRICGMTWGGLTGGEERTGLAAWPEVRVDELVV